MGIVRLLLGLLVVGSHFGGLAEPAGGTAVSAFFAISGFLMARTIHENYPGFAGARRFYVNRAVRILPPFIVVLVATALILWLRDSRPFLVSPTGGTWLPDTNFPPHWHDLASLGRSDYPYFWSAQVYLAPQAWSLMVEGVFYLAAPLLVMLARKPLRPTLWLLLLGTFALSLVAALPPLASNHWMRSPVASLWVFVLGVLAYTYAPKGAAEAPTGIRRVVGVAALLCVAALGLHETPLERTALYLSPLLVTLWLLTHNWSVRRGGEWDRRIGNLAYGVFIGHFLFALIKAWLAEGTYHLTGGFGLFGVPGLTTTYERLWRYSFYVGSIIGAAVLYVVVERPLDRLRARIRRAS